jgi:hypothetical protein
MAVRGAIEYTFHYVTKGPDTDNKGMMALLKRTMEALARKDPHSQLSRRSIFTHIGNALSASTRVGAPAMVWLLCNLPIIKASRSFLTLTADATNKLPEVGVVNERGIEIAPAATSKRGRREAYIQFSEEQRKLLQSEESLSISEYALFTNYKITEIKSTSPAWQAITQTGVPVLKLPLTKEPVYAGWTENERMKLAATPIISGERRSFVIGRFKYTPLAETEAPVIRVVPHAMSDETCPIYCKSMIYAHFPYSDESQLFANASSGSVSASELFLTLQSEGRFPFYASVLMSTTASSDLLLRTKPQTYQSSDNVSLDIINTDTSAVDEPNDGDMLMHEQYDDNEAKQYEFRDTATIYSYDNIDRSGTHIQAGPANNSNSFMGQIENGGCGYIRELQERFVNQTIDQFAQKTNNSATDTTDHQLRRTEHASRQRDAYFEIKTEKCNAQQKLALTYMEAALLMEQGINDEYKQLLLTISGEGGTGKSFCIKLIQDFAATILCKRSRDALYNIVLPVGTQGSVASLIDGYTLHSSILLRPNAGKAAIAKWAQKLEVTRIIIVDEMSLLNTNMLVDLDKSLKKIRLALNPIDGNDTATNNAINQRLGNMPFGGFHIVLAGDFYQIAPVLPHSLAKINLSRHTGIEMQDEGKLLFTQHFDYFVELTENMRIQGSANAEYAKTVQKCRTGKQTLTDLKFLNTRVMNTEALVNEVVTQGKEHPLTTTYRNDTVNELNKAAYDQACINNPHEQFVSPAYHEGTNEFSNEIKTVRILKALHAQKSDSRANSFTANLESVLHLSVGQRVYFTSNIATQLGIYNGATGTIHSIRWPAQYTLTKDTMTFGQLYPHEIEALLTPSIKLGELSASHETDASNDAAKYIRSNAMHDIRSHESWLHRAPTIFVKMDKLKNLPGNPDTPTTCLAGEEHVVPVTLFKGQRIVYNKGTGAAYYRWQYPLKPAAALTLHKTQGRTTAIHYIKTTIKMAFAYMAISRATGIHDLYLSCPLTHQDFKVSPDVEKMYEYLRSKTNTYCTDDEHAKLLNRDVTMTMSPLNILTTSHQQSAD